MTERRTYVGELEWALQQVNSVFANDRDPNRAAKLRAAVEYGLAVAIARRGRGAIPERPDVERAC